MSFDTRDRVSDRVQARDSRLRAPAPGPAPAPALGAASAVDVEIVVPVLNEERALGPSIRRLAAYLRDEFPFRAIITIADNGSTDRTWTIATELATELSDVRAVRLAERGRGRALRACWLASEAEVVAYMDVDLSSGLEGLLPLVAPLLSGHSDLTIGTRLARGARVIRGPKRELASRCYNLLLQAALEAGFSDAQCGFKAIVADKARLLLPLVRDNAWFFDTELLILAERAGLRIHEVPVDWVDDPDSRVHVLQTAMKDLHGVARLWWDYFRGRPAIPSELATEHASRTARSLPSQITRFMGIGVVSLLAYVVIYLLLRTTMYTQAANAISLFLTAVANTAANRRITFGIRGYGQAFLHQLQGVIAFGAGLMLTAIALVALNAAAPRSSRVTELAVLITANLVATAVRFVLYRSWVFRPRRVPPPRWPADTAREAAHEAAVPAISVNADNAW